MQKKYDNYQEILPFKLNETGAKGIYSINSTLSSLQEIIILYLKVLSFYANRLNNMNVRDKSINEIVIHSIFNLTTNADFKQNEFSTIISNLYEAIQKSKNIYYEKCKELNIEPENLKTYFKLQRDFSTAEAIRKGEKYSLKKSQAYTNEQKTFFDIMFILLKSLAIRIVETHRLKRDCEECFYGAIALLDAMNFANYSIENTKQEINKIIEIYHKSEKLLYDSQKDLFGPIEPTMVSFSSRPGKAILVSGSDFQKLKNILEATKNTEIDVYTHGTEMIMAHAFHEFKKYPNLIGHYGFGMESSLIDFATFPGAIIMTKGTLQRVDFLYRGRLFTLDPIPPMGVLRLKTNDMSPLIKSALEAKGFSKGQTRPSINVGYDENELIKKVKEIIPKVLSGEIKHLFIIGLINFINNNKSYFEEFFEKMPDDCFAFSLCCPLMSENIFHLKSFYDYSFLYRLLDAIETIAPLNSLPLTIFVTRCDKHTISNLLYLKSKEIKHIFMNKCSPTLLNPSIIKNVQSLYDIHEFDNVESDIKLALS